MNTQHKIHSNLDSLLRVVANWKASKKQIVFTNGCYDILHFGHIDSLEKAKSLGDKLIVAVNTDKSVKALKGDSRPVNNQESRLRVIAALGCVDLVISFDEETPFSLIKNILPSLLVKGKDYDVGNIVGADIVIANGGRVETVDIVPGYSTSNVLDRIKNKE